MSDSSHVDELEAFAADVETVRLQARAAAGDGWIEPWAGSDQPRPSASAAAGPRCSCSTAPIRSRWRASRARSIRRRTLFIVSSKVRRHARAEHPQGVFLQAGRGRARCGQERARISSRSPIQARTWRTSRKPTASARSSTATRKSGAATRCSPISDWCRLRLPASTCARSSRAHASWRGPARTACRPLQNPGVQLGAVLGTLATRFEPRQGDVRRRRRGSTISAPGSSSSWPRAPASKAMA